jgi:hypothetical protein
MQVHIFDQVVDLTDEAVAAIEHAVKFEAVADVAAVPEVVPPVEDHAVQVPVEAQLGGASNKVNE